MTRNVVIADRWLLIARRVFISASRKQHESLFLFRDFSESDARPSADLRGQPDLRVSSQAARCRSRFTISRSTFQPPVESQGTRPRIYRDPFVALASITTI